MRGKIQATTNEHGSNTGEWMTACVKCDYAVNIILVRVTGNEQEVILDRIY